MRGSSRISDFRKFEKSGYFALYEPYIVQTQYLYRFCVALMYKIVKMHFRDLGLPKLGNVAEFKVLVFRTNILNSVDGGVL